MAFPQRIPISLFAAICLLAGKALIAQSPAAPLDYNRDVRPVLSDKCFFCHGPDSAQRQAGLRLDIRQEAVEAGVIDEEDPASSLLIERITAGDPGERMPPPSSHKPLSNEERELLVRWVREGAVYQDHWSYRIPVRPEVAGSTGEEEPGTHPIDILIGKQRDRAMNPPLPLADGATLLRRLSFDLLGLPPEPDDLRRRDEIPNDDAWTALVNELLARPQYGERMATPWLDVVRYADTVGYHGDQNHNAWAWRDWVIRSFNENKPFDEFTIEQLAGDLLPEPSTDQLVATGFNRLNMVTREGGAQPDEYLARYMADRVRTVSTAWLGITMGCAQCHDHKYDPATARDFYALGAFFADIQQWGVYHDYPYTPNPDLRGFSNDHPFPPEIEVISPFLLHRMERIRGEQMDLVAKAELDQDDKIHFWRQWAAEWRIQHPDGWKAVSVAEIQSDTASPRLERLDDGSVRFLGDAPTILEFSADETLAAVRIELLNAAPEGQPASIRRDGRTQNDDEGIRLAPLFSVRRAGSDKTERLAVHLADANRKKPIYSNGFPLIGIAGGWQTAGCSDDHFAVFIFEKPQVLAKGDRLIVDCRDQQAVGRMRVGFSPLVPLHPENMLERPELPDAGPELRLAYVRATGEPPDLHEAIQERDREYVSCREGKTPVLVTRSVQPAETRILKRGNWQDRTGEMVEPAVPHYLPQIAANGKRLTRLDLAQWLVSDDNPLVARVIMNRLWQQFFGQGLVATPDDFGSQGMHPSNPELLDWLACEFRDCGWDLKHMVRLIVTSREYRRQSTVADGTDPVSAADRSPLGRQYPRRLTAEMVRDNALAIAGLLNPEPGGPPFQPLQPEGYYAHLQFPDRQVRESGERDRFRRSVYIHWQRTFLYPLLLHFDAPTREDCTAMRNEANNPQQALTLLNDPAFLEIAAAFAERLIRDVPGERIGERLDYAFELALFRKPDDFERESLAALVASLEDIYRAEPEQAAQVAAARRYTHRDPSIDPVELAVWTNIARVLLNLHETITRY